MSVHAAQGPLTTTWHLPLPGVDGERRSLSALGGSLATVVVFVAGGCPTVRSYEERLMRLHDAVRPHGVALVAVNSNNPYLSPPDTLAEMRKRARARNFNFAYLKDAEGTLARSFGAICTPHAFIVDSELHTLYRGRIDDSRVGDTVSRHELRDAIEAVIAGEPVSVPETEPFGCSIIW
jgi:peroxiredoxin